MTRRALAAALVALALGCSATGPAAPTLAPVGDRWSTSVDFADEIVVLEAGTVSGLRSVGAIDHTVIGAALATSITLSLRCPR